MADRTITTREFAVIVYDAIRALAPPDLSFKGYPVEHVLTVEEVRKEFYLDYGSLYLKLERGWSVEPTLEITLRDGVPNISVKCSGTGRSLTHTRALCVALSSLADIGCLIESYVAGRSIVADEEKDKAHDDENPAYRKFTVEELKALPKGSFLTEPNGKGFFKVMEPAEEDFAWSYHDGTVTHEDVTRYRVRLSREGLPARKERV